MSARELIKFVTPGNPHSVSRTISFVDDTPKFHNWELDIGSRAGAGTAAVAAGNRDDAQDPFALKYPSFQSLYKALFIVNYLNIL